MSHTMSKEIADELTAGRSPVFGPKAGNRVTVKESIPPGVYPLRSGLKAGEIVKLLDFDHGWWTVEREQDGARIQIFVVNIDRVCSAT